MSYRIRTRDVRDVYGDAPHSRLEYLAERRIRLLWFIRLWVPIAGWRFKQWHAEQDIHNDTYEREINT